MTRRFYRVSAFISGLALVLACVYVGDYLAALAVPKAYFAFFGREHQRLALATLSCITVAVPFFLVSLAWCWLMLRGRGAAIRSAAWCCVAGMAAGLIYVLVWSGLTLRAAEALAAPPSLFAYLLRVTPPWWALPQMLALPGGLAVAAMLSRRGDGDYR